MTDKERLEEFKKQIEFLDDSADMDDFGRFVDTLQNMYEDGEFHWIVRYLKEQAERVQELEDKYNNLRILLDIDGRVRMQEQNKRYREALEEIANSDGWLIEPNHLCTIEEAYERCVETAHQALEAER